MSKQIYGVVTQTTSAAIRARAKRLGMGVPLFPGDASLAAVFAHIKALEMGYQNPQILIDTDAFKTPAAFVAAQSVASQYRASIILNGTIQGLPAEDAPEVIKAIAELITEMCKYSADPTVAKQVFGRPPYGYLRVNKKLAIDEGAAALIAEAFRIHDQGKTLDVILQALQSKFPGATVTSSGGPWHKARVSRILRRVDMYRRGKFRDCDGRRYTSAALVIAPEPKKAAS